MNTDKTFGFNICVHLCSSAALFLYFAFSPALSAADLAGRIDKLLADSPAAAAFWGIEIRDLKTGEVVYSQNQNKFFVPASNTKLFTIALALNRLGPNYTFETRVVADRAPDRSGRIGGDLRLVGGGDPDLSARTIPYAPGPVTGNPLAAIEDLADQVVARGIRGVSGGIVGDDTRYVWEPYGENWSIGDPQFEYGAPVSALTVNDNAFVLRVRPGPRAGDPAELELDPPLEYYTIDNRVITVPRGGPRQVHFERLPGSFHVDLWGTLPAASAPDDLELGIEDPALYAALAFRKALEERGVTVDGEARAEHQYPTRDGQAATAWVELARRTSPPLVDDLKITAKVSQNLHAEMVLRAAGVARRGEGSREAGMAELKDFLASAGIPPDGYSFGDGSGLARSNLVTPATVVELLRYMYDSPWRDAWLDLLPSAGEDGTLSARFTDGPAKGRIRAKTGSLSHVNALSGYAQRQSGEWLVFSIIVNNAGAPSSQVRGIMDRICNLIVE
jgi:D-alanyl-D-alanine carboxypeptidase/D-alanyl-D-alanine-endopeptidase (penicillin-binding protein 4)